MKIQSAYCRNCHLRWTADKRYCPECLSDNLDKQEITGEGTVFSYTKIHAAPKRYRDEAPYTVILVDLDDGLRITGRLSGEHIEIGQKVAINEMQNGAYLFKVT